MTAEHLAAIWPARWPRPSDHSNAQHRRMVKPFGEHFAGRELASISREEAREWALKHPTNARYVRTMFFDAMRDGLATTNPFAALRISPPRRERYFPSTEEVETLIRAAEEPLRGRIRFSAYTGLRLGEMLAVRPCDFADGRVNVRWQINSRDERVPRKGKVKDYWALVPEQARISPSWLLLSHGHAERLWPLPRHAYNKEWRRLRKSLKLPENFVWHSLRHHAATWFLDQGASFEDVAIQLGHDDSGVQVRETYGHMSREKALDRLEAVVS